MEVQNMWQYFTERGKKVIQLAHREALRMGHDVIGTEHILMGLAAEGEGVPLRYCSLRCVPG
jgi:ATP-dependent Clp protease ATP-binding subunit ClpC